MGKEKPEAACDIGRQAYRPLPSGGSIGIVEMVGQAVLAAGAGDEPEEGIGVVVQLLQSPYRRAAAAAAARPPRYICPTVAAAGNVSHEAMNAILLDRREAAVPPLQSPVRRGGRGQQPAESACHPMKNWPTRTPAHPQPAYTGCFGADEHACSQADEAASRRRQGPSVSASVEARRHRK